MQPDKYLACKKDKSLRYSTYGIMPGAILSISSVDSHSLTEQILQVLYLQF